MSQNPDENLAVVNSAEAEKESLIGLQQWRTTQKQQAIDLINEARAKE